MIKKNAKQICYTKWGRWRSEKKIQWLSSPLSSLLRDNSWEYLGTIIYICYIYIDNVYIYIYIYKYFYCVHTQTHVFYLTGTIQYVLFIRTCPCHLRKEGALWKLLGSPIFSTPFSPVSTRMVPVSRFSLAPLNKTILPQNLLSPGPALFYKRCFCSLSSLFPARVWALATTFRPAPSTALGHGPVSLGVVEGMHI